MVKGCTLIFTLNFLREIHNIFMTTLKFRFIQWIKYSFQLNRINTWSIYNKGLILYGARL